MKRADALLIGTGEVSLAGDKSLGAVSLSRLTRSRHLRESLAQVRGVLMVAANYIEMPPGHGQALSVSFTPADTNNYTLSATTVSIDVVDALTPGQMEGEGRITQGRTEYEFELRELRTGADRGHLRLEVDPNRRERGHSTFVVASWSAVVFSADPGTRPDRDRRPMIDVVDAAGAGSWNGAAGYTFQMHAVDAERERGGDQFALVVWNAQGVIVAQVSGTIQAGDIRSSRLDER